MNTETKTAVAFQAVKAATVAVEAKERLVRREMRRAISRELFVKQFNKAENDLRKLLVPVFEEQIRSMAGRLRGIAGKVVADGLTEKFNPHHDSLGRFATGGFGGAGGSSQTPRAMRVTHDKETIKKLREQYEKDEEFRKIANGISMYTAGYFIPVRQVSSYLRGSSNPLEASTSWEDRARIAGKTLSDLIVEKNNSISNALVKDSDILGDNKTTMAEVVGKINKAIESAPVTTEPLYRGVPQSGFAGKSGDVTFGWDGKNQPKIGEEIRVAGITSFTKEKTVAEAFSQGKAEGQNPMLSAFVNGGIVFKLEKGAKALDVKDMSDWRQSEALTFGTFKVTSSKEREWKASDASPFDDPRYVLEIGLKQVSTDYKLTTKAADSQESETSFVQQTFGCALTELDGGSVESPIKKSSDITKSSSLTTASLVKQIFDPTEWKDKIIDRLLPTMVVQMAEAAAGELITAGIDVRKKGMRRVGRKFNPAHDSLGRFATGGSGGGAGSALAPDTGGGTGGSSGSGTSRFADRGMVQIIRRGKQWMLSNGQPLPDHLPKQIPPAWKNVYANPDSKADLLVVGLDKNGKEQGIYSISHKMNAAAAKFARTNELRAKLQQIQDQMNKDVKDPTVKETAACARLIMKTGLRPGDKASSKAFGATTLQGRHVKIRKNGVQLDFIGKKGVHIKLLVDDPVLVKDLLARKAKVGNREQLFDTDKSKVLRYSKSTDGGGFKTKDFRTAVGTNAAVELIKKAKPPTNEKEYKKAVRQVAAGVSSRLGNTPTVALQSYIDPAVWSKWRAGLSR